jgi:two-component system, NarL family, nitrate/nitrite response regulator NarL
LTPALPNFSNLIDRQDIFMLPRAVDVTLRAPEPVGPAHAVRIAIADDHPIFRDGLRRLLETAPDLRIVGDADASQAIALVQTLRPDILLIGGSASAVLSIEAVQRMVGAGATVRVIVLTRSVEGPAVVAALRFGAHGVLPRDTTPDALFKSIKSVMAGHCWAGRESVSNMAVGVRRLDQASRDSKAFGLTHRELEIVRALMNGETNRAIAQRFSISQNTVKRHITHIFNKVGASTRVELAMFVAHHNLV